MMLKFVGLYIVIKRLSIESKILEDVNIRNWRKVKEIKNK